MGQDGPKRYQLAGSDERERGFSRPVDVERVGDDYRAILRYETTHMTTALYSTSDAAIVALIQTLHAKGYRQLKTQASFRKGVYLGSQEPWVEYPDPISAEFKAWGFIATVRGWFRRSAPNRNP
ncbi:MAG TPA: hypothetical protein VIU63_10340 [Nitrospira sp.]